MSQTPAGPSGPTPSFPLRPTPACPWRPLNDAEWAELSRILRRSARGRPPADARRAWDGIFWVACSKGPWREMPAAFGRADTAHRTLRRAALGRQLHALLLRASAHPGFADSPLRAIAWFIVRAFRRAFRVAARAIFYARHLGLLSALPAAPIWLPNPNLSEAVKDIGHRIRHQAGRLSLPFLQAMHCLFRRSAGEPRFWKTTE